jgi:hypothetical protein
MSFDLPKKLMLAHKQRKSAPTRLNSFETHKKSNRMRQQNKKTPKTRVAPCLQNLPILLPPVQLDVNHQNLVDKMI